MANHKPKLKTPLPVVELHPLGKKAVSWRKDPVILTRLVSVAEVLLRGGSVLHIANTFDCSLATAKRDVARVKTLWREQSLEDLADLRSRSIAQYLLVITKSWAEFHKKASPNWLGKILDAQARIDDIQGNQAPKELLVGDLDIEAVRQKRWESVQGMLADIVAEEDEMSDLGQPKAHAADIAISLKEK
jgi:hypothetical protein